MGYDNNALYFWPSCKIILLDGSRETEETGFKRESSSKTATKRLEWKAHVGGIQICLQINDKEKRIGEWRLLLDGFLSPFQTVLQFQECWWHGHDCHLIEKKKRNMKEKETNATSKQIRKSPKYGLSLPLCPALSCPVLFSPPLLLSFLPSPSPLLLSSPLSSSHLLSSPLLLSPLLSYAILAFSILPCRILSYLILSYPILSYPLLSHPVLSYSALSCPVLCFSVLSLVQTVCARSKNYFPESILDVPLVNSAESVALKFEHKTKTKTTSSPWIQEDTTLQTILVGAIDKINLHIKYFYRDVVIFGAFDLNCPVFSTHRELLLCQICCPCPKDCGVPSSN